MANERVVSFRARTILGILGILILVAIVLDVIWIARDVLTWILIALFFALALNPAVEWLQRRGVRRRGLAVAVAYLTTLVGVAGIGAAFIPTVVSQVNSFANQVPGYIDDLTEGRGRLGRLAQRYDVVDKVERAVRTGGVKRLAAGAGTALNITRSVITAIVAIVTIAFMTFFMLLEGPTWIGRLYGLLPEDKQPRWRAVGRDIYRTIGGYVSGNLLISLIAGVAAGLVLFGVGVPFAVALALVVAILDLIPLAGATLAAIVVVLVTLAATSLTKALIMAAYFLVYQQAENHLIQPLVYGRTVKLSPLAVLIAILIGAEVAGILGALAAIPVAGSIQVIIVDWLAHRRRQIAEPAAPG